MKHILLYITCCFLIHTGLYAQQRIIAQKGIECGTKAPAKPFEITAQQMQQAMNSRTVAAVYPIKIFFHITANDNGTRPACGDSSVLRQLTNAMNFYAPQNICFVLTGVERINSTDLTRQNVETEADELLPYLIPNSMNVFVHDSLFDTTALNGYAYNIPGTYLSISDGAIESADNLSTLAHELGHCFNLFHTFETAYGMENVSRSGDCKNCEDAGDKLCDTRADPQSKDYDLGNYTNANCVYTGVRMDNCGVTYNTDPRNIMAYGRRSCRSLFTSGQGARMRATIDSDDDLNSRTAPSSLTVSSSVSLSSGRRNDAASGAVFINSPSYAVSGSSKVNIVGNSITLRPGVSLKPSSGYTWVRVNTFCN